MPTLDERKGTQITASSGEVIAHARPKPRSDLTRTQWDATLTHTGAKMWDQNGMYARDPFKEFANEHGTAVHVFYQGRSIATIYPDADRWTPVGPGRANEMGEARRRWTREQLGYAMQHWHSSGGDPIYAVGSYYGSNKPYPDPAVVERALSSIESYIPRAEHEEKGTGWTKRDARDLRSIAAGLRYYLKHDYVAPTRAHEMNEEWAPGASEMGEAPRHIRKHRRDEQRHGSFVVVISDGAQQRFNEMRDAQAWAIQRLQPLPPGSTALFYRAQIAPDRSDTGSPWTEPFSALEKNEYGHIVQGRIPQRNTGPFAHEMNEEWAPGGARIMMARGGVVTIPGGRAHEYVPPHPDRTGYRNASGRDPMNFDVTFKEWPNRASLLKTIEMQGQREPRQDDWKDWLTSRYNPANRVTREMNEANPPEHRRRRALGGPPGPGRGTPHRNPDAGRLATELSKAVGGTTPKEAIHFNGDHEGYQFTTSSPEYNQTVVVVLSNEKGGNISLSIYADEDRRNTYESIHNFLFGPDGFTSHTSSVAAMKETVEDVWKTVDGYARSWDESEGGDMEEAPKKKKRAKPKAKPKKRK